MCYLDHRNSARICRDLYRHSYFRSQKDYNSDNPNLPTPNHRDTFPTNKCHGRCRGKHSRCPCPGKSASEFNLNNKNKLENKIN